MSTGDPKLLLMIALGDGVPVQSDLLGTTWTLAFPAWGAVGELVLPLAPASTVAQNDALLCPVVDGAEEALEWFQGCATDEDGDEDEDDDASTWGEMSGVAEAFVLRAVVTTSLADLDAADLGDAASDILGAALDGWIDRFCDWLELVAEVDLQEAVGAQRTVPKHVFPIPVVVLDTEV